MSGSNICSNGKIEREKMKDMMSEMSRIIHLSGGKYEADEVG